PGHSATINLAVNPVPINTTYNSTLICTFDNDIDDTSFSWPVSASCPLSAVAVPSIMNASPMAFGMNTTFSFDMANDATAMLDLDNINCSYSGGDVGQFSVTSGQPAGPVAPGNSATINLAVNPVPINTTYNSTLICTFDNDIDDTSFSWPVSASGVISAIAVPSLADGETIVFGTASDSRIRISNAISAGTTLDSINCSYMGADAMQYSIASAQPAGPVAPGGFVYIDLYVNDVPDGQTYTSTLSCTFINDINVSSFSWPVIASGPEVIPTLSQYGLALLLGLMLLIGFRFQRKR
ncbi:MAG: IPTL-CTERM sorting domain-containing protein, partial [Proteobacteria bacterium]|nr:IPTL-CTERM sorting domain-containing protein [Pseudomonadota bacterium]